MHEFFNNNFHVFFTLELDLPGGNRTRAFDSQNLVIGLLLTMRGSILLYEAGEHDLRVCFRYCIDIQILIK